MKVNINGLRQSLTIDFNTLVEFLEWLLSDLENNGYRVNDFFDREELARLVNQNAQNIGVLNCVYDNNYADDFDDLSSKLQVRFIEEKDD